MIFTCGVCEWVQCIFANFWINCRPTLHIALHMAHGFDCSWLIPVQRWKIRKFKRFSRKSGTKKSNEKPLNNYKFPKSFRLTGTKKKRKNKQPCYLIVNTKKSFYFDDFAICLFCIVIIKYYQNFSRCYFNYFYHFSSNFTTLSYDLPLVSGIKINANKADKKQEPLNNIKQPYNSIELRRFRYAKFVTNPNTHMLMQVTVIVTLRIWNINLQSVM